MQADRPVTGAIRAWAMTADKAKITFSRANTRRYLRAQRTLAVAKRCRADRGVLAGTLTIRR
jgi:hypothetical protein